MKESVVATKCEQTPEGPLKTVRKLNDLATECEQSPDDSTLLVTDENDKPARPPVISSTCPAYIEGNPDNCGKTKSKITEFFKKTDSIRNSNSNTIPAGSPTAPNPRKFPSKKVRPHKKLSLIKSFDDKNQPKIIGFTKRLTSERNSTRPPDYPNLHPDETPLVPKGI